MDDQFLAQFRERLELTTEPEKAYEIIRENLHQITLQFLDEEGNELPIDPKYQPLMTEPQVVPEQFAWEPFVEKYRNDLLTVLRQMSPGELLIGTQSAPEIPVEEEPTTGQGRRTYRRKKSVK